MLLTEYVSHRGELAVDRQGSVLRGVKVLGLLSANRRRYLPEAIDAAALLYEGAKVNVNHVGRGEEPRDYRDRIGCLRNPRVQPAGLFADLHFNPKHLLAEQLLWDAEHAPENLGLSHVVEARTRDIEGQTVVEEIRRVISVDLVADPATTKSLFEGGDMDLPGSASQAADQAAASGDMTWEMFVDRARTIFQGDADPAAKGKALASLVRALLKLHDETDVEGPGPLGAGVDALRREAAALREQLDTFQAREALAARQAQVEAALADARLPAELVTELFRQQLAAADDAGRARLIEDRQAIAATARPGPQSREQRLTERGAANDSASFARAVASG